MNIRKVHLVVTGRVQGVFFRASTTKFASKVGITGWVRNLSNGSVEVVGEGSEEMISPFITWLNTGPVFAKVNEVQIISDEYHPSLEFSDFRTIS